MVLSTVSDNVLRSTSGSTNSDILRAAHELWPEAKVVVTADSPKMTARLYSEGAYYVLRVSELCADRLIEILHEMTETVGHEAYDASRALTSHSVAVSYSRKSLGGAQHKKGDKMAQTQSREGRVSKHHIKF